MPKKLAFAFIKYGARDHARVPMQWDDSVNAGFNTGAEPWQCMNPEYKEINVRRDLESEKSIYHYYQKLLAIKKGNETAVYGETEEYDHDDRQIIAYSREYEGSKLFIVGNFSGKPATYKLPAWLNGGCVLLNNYGMLNRSGRTVVLEPYQAIVVEKK